jgi:hypothetical protein
VTVDAHVRKPVPNFVRSRLAARGDPKKIHHESPKARKHERRDERGLGLEKAEDVFLFVLSNFRAFVIVLMLLPSF